MEEEWRSIERYPGYEASSHGRIRSFKKRGKGKGWFISDEPQRILHPSDNGQGYLCVNLSSNGMSNVLRVHRLIALVFLGPCPSGKEVCHNDGNKQNNHIGNLRYDTRDMNGLDRSFHRDGCSADEMLAIYRKAGLLPEKENNDA